MSESDVLLSKAKMALQNHRTWMNKYSSSVSVPAVYTRAIPTATKTAFSSDDEDIDSSAKYPTAKVQKAENGGRKATTRKETRRKPSAVDSVITYTPGEPNISSSPIVSSEEGKEHSVFSPLPKAQAWSTPTRERKAPVPPPLSLPVEEPGKEESIAMDSSISSMSSQEAELSGARQTAVSSEMNADRDGYSLRLQEADYPDDLNSQSVARIVCVSPAPDHLRTDTTHARYSKMGPISVDNKDKGSAESSKYSAQEVLYRRVAASKDDAGKEGSLETIPEATKRLVLSLKPGDYQDADGGGNMNTHSREGEYDGATSEMGALGKDGRKNTGMTMSPETQQLGKKTSVMKQDTDLVMKHLVMPAPSTRGLSVIKMEAKPEENLTATVKMSTSLTQPSSGPAMSSVLKTQDNCTDNLHHLSHKELNRDTTPTQDVLNGTRLPFRREKAPPPYILQVPDKVASSPACPLYGVVQATDKDVMKISVMPSEKLKTESVAKAPRKSAIDTTSRPSIEENNASFPLVPLKSSIPQNGHLSYSDAEEDPVPSSGLHRMPTGPGPLHLLARTGNMRKLQAAIEEGHDVNAQDHEGKTPLMYCITYIGVHLSCADLLLKEGANLDHQSSDGSTALHIASFAGALSLVELMLLNGANPDIPDHEGRLPLHWATKPKSPKCISTLLKNSNFDINKGDDSGMTALMWACHFDNAPVVTYLLANGADVEEKDKDGLTAMHWAINKNSIQCLQLLLKPDMTYFKDHNGLTVMHKAALEGSVLACEHILSMRGDALHDTDKKGRTPLHYAAACSKVDVCALLLDKGADVSQKDHFGHTPLDYAYTKKLDYVVALFMCHETSVADFARVSRSVISASYVSLAQSENMGIDEKNTSLSTTLFKTLTEGSHVPAGFLGKYSNNGKGPLHHYYFWLTAQTKEICWSRSSNMRAPQVAQVQSVHAGAGDTVRSRLDYSPLDIHKYSFWVVTTSGVLDLIAYSEDKYVLWLTQINEIAHERCDDLLGLLSSPQASKPATTTPVSIRHAWTDGNITRDSSSGSGLQSTSATHGTPVIS